MAYICFSKGKEVFNYYGESCGISEDRLLYKAICLNSDRVYRRSKTESDEFELFEFDILKEAQELCDEINNAYNDDFKVLEI